MPVHDWTRVSAGTFHHFHTVWIGQLSIALNDGLLPLDYEAFAEQDAGQAGPDVVTLQGNGAAGEDASQGGAGGTAIAPRAQTASPRSRFMGTIDIDPYTLKRRSIIIRHTSDKRVVALIEILSAGNKSSRHAVRSFLRKTTGALVQGIHLLLVDLYPPGRRDPQGIHAAVWAEISDDPFELPQEKRLTLASYAAGRPTRYFVEPVAVGDALPDMPLYLEPDLYINIPLEATYREAWRGVSQSVKRVLEEKSD